MKTNKLFKTILFVLCMIGGANAAWADDAADFSALSTAISGASSNVTINLTGTTYQGTLTLPDNSVTITIQGTGSQVLNVKFEGTASSANTPSILFKDVIIKPNNNYLFDLANCGDISQLAFTNCEITNDATSRRGIMQNGSSSKTISSVSFNNCKIHDIGNGWNFMYPIHVVVDVSCTNSTLYNYNGESFFYARTETTSAISFTFTNNTVYKWGKGDGIRGICNISGPGEKKFTNTENSFTFKDNIFWDFYNSGSEGTNKENICLIVSKKNKGTCNIKNNVIYNYKSDFVWATSEGDFAITINKEDNITSLSTLSSIFYDASVATNYNFGVLTSNATLKTASSTDGLLCGDPEWKVWDLNESTNYTPTAESNTKVRLTRTISASKWNTICLPFSMDNTTLKATYGDDVKIANFTGYNSATKELQFTKMADGTDAITANTPCLIKVSSAVVSEEKVISGVTIATGTPTVTFSPAVFTGVYASTTMTAGDYFISGGKLYKATAASQDVKPFRAYFTGVPSEARLAIDEGFGEVTRIDLPGADKQTTDGSYYNLQGQRIQQPTKGLYIVNGRKVIVK